MTSRRDLLLPFHLSAFPPQGGAASSRILESHLWECKQLGAYSPMVLLNTLLFFCTKHFGFTTLAQHRGISFTNFTRCSRPCSRAGKVHCLRHHKRTGAGAAPPCGEKGNCSLGSVLETFWAAPRLVAARGVDE